MGTLINLKDWLNLSSEQRKAVYDSWDKDSGEGEEVVKGLYELFREKYEKLPDVVLLSYGTYYGGEWVISITLRVGHRVEVQDDFHGIRVVKLFAGLASLLKRKLVQEYNGDIEKFVDGEIQEFRRCFDFTDAPHAREALIAFVKQHKDTDLPDVKTYLKSM